jgi:glutaredoxin 2
MALGFLNQDYESIVLPYDDEKTPLSLMGKKMLPIFSFTQGVSNESLDIIQRLDAKNLLQTTETLNNIENLNDLTAKIGKDVHSLAMPYWIWTPEFNEQSRHYFQSKKEIKRGPFKKLVQEKSKFIKNLNITLSEVEAKLKPFYESEKFSLSDIIIASHLWGMYVVPEFQFSPKVHAYLQEVAKICKFNYHEDFWR